MAKILQEQATVLLKTGFSGLSYLCRPKTTLIYSIRSRRRKRKKNNNNNNKTKLKVFLSNFVFTNKVTAYRSYRGLESSWNSEV